MKKLILFLLIFPAVAVSQTCTVIDTIRTQGGSGNVVPKKNAVIYVRSTKDLQGRLMSTEEVSAKSDSNGIITLRLMRNSDVTLFSQDVQRFSPSVVVRVPDAATAILKEIYPASALPTGYICAVSTVSDTALISAIISDSLDADPRSGSGTTDQAARDTATVANKAAQTALQRASAPRDSTTINGAKSDSFTIPIISDSERGPRDSTTINGSKGNSFTIPIVSDAERGARDSVTIGGLKSNSFPLAAPLRLATATIGLGGDDSLRLTPTQRDISQARKDSAGIAAAALDTAKLGNTNAQTALTKAAIALDTAKLGNVNSQTALGKITVLQDTATAHKTRFDAQRDTSGNWQTVQNTNAYTLAAAALPSASFTDTSGSWLTAAVKAAQDTLREGNIVRSGALVTALLSYVRTDTADANFVRSGALVTALTSYLRTDTANANFMRGLAAAATFLRIDTANINYVRSGAFTAGLATKLAVTDTSKQIRNSTSGVSGTQQIYSGLTVGGTNPVTLSASTFYTGGVVPGLLLKNSVTNTRTLLGIAPNGATGSNADVWLFDSSSTVNDISAIAWGLQGTRVTGYWGWNVVRDGRSNSHPIYFNATNGQTAATSNLFLDTVGRVAIGNIAPRMKLDVTGTVRCTDTLRTGTYTTYSYIIPGGALVSSSTKEIKTAIADFQTPATLAEKFASVKPKTYKFKPEVFRKNIELSDVPEGIISGKKYTKEQRDFMRATKQNEADADAEKQAARTYTGFLAEDFNSAFGDPNSKEIDQSKVIAVMWKMIQAQQAEIESLKTRMTKLEKKP